MKKSGKKFGGKWIVALGTLVVLGAVYAADAIFGTGCAGVALAAAPLLVIPKDSKDVPAIRTFFDGVKQLCSASSTFDGPIRQMMDDLKARVDAALAALPVEDSANWSVNDKVTDLLSLLGCSNNLAAGLLLEINKMKQQMAGMVVLDTAIADGIVVKKDDVTTQVTAAVTAAITERTGEKGDLTTKELSQQLCSAAKANGIQEGIAQRNTELTTAAAAETTATERKTALTTAGLPLPEAATEAILKAEAAAFELAKTAAGDRLKKLTEAGLNLEALTPQLGKVWLDEAGYKTFESTVMSIPALKKAARVDEPLASGSAGGGTGKIVI